MHSHKLTRHRDIRDWVSERHGTPAIRRVPNRFGEIRARLDLVFHKQRAMPPGGMPQVDDGASPVSWSAWLAELDRRQLALKVSDQQSADFELVPRSDLN